MAPSVLSGAARVRMTSWLGIVSAWVMESARGRPETVGAEVSRSGASSSQESRQTSGVVQMFHVVCTGGLEIEEDGNLASELVEGVEIERNARAGGNCGEVDESIGGSADGLEDDAGVADRGGSDEIAGAR